MPTDELLSTSEAADQLGVSPVTVQRLIRRGTLSAIRVGGSSGYRIAASEVRRALQKLGVQTREGLLANLLTYRKTNRDPVHGDIKLTELELRLIDTECFQRLHGIRQLGFAHLVYTGAEHSRFGHSLGCMRVADQIATMVNDNPHGDISIAPIDRVVLRICALLHDVAHVPFGHSLEDEGHVLQESQWADPNRVKYHLGDDSEIAHAIRTYEPLASQDMVPELAPDALLQTIRQILVAIDTERIDELPKPYIGDIIGGTVCADLFDYLRRDSYYAGLKSDYDERLLSYFYITEHRGKERLVLRLVKTSTGERRRDIESELMQLLRLRYELSERMYYHHAKVTASAMIVSAVQAAIQAGHVTSQDLYACQDDVLLDRLGRIGAPDDRHRYIVKRLKRRSLYRRVIGYELATARGRLDRFVDYGQPETRSRLERDLEIQNDLPSGSVIVYCPISQRWRPKALNVLVEAEGGDIVDIGSSTLKSEVGELIGKYEALPAMYVLVDREHADLRTMQNIHGDVRSRITGLEPLSRFDRFVDDLYRHYLFRFDERYCEEHKGARRLTESDVRALMREAEGAPLPYDDFARRRDDRVGESSAVGD